MLKRYWPTIPLAMFFALAVFFEWSSANAPRPINQSGGGKHATKYPVNNDPSVFLATGVWIGDHHDAIEAAAAALSVIFTVALVGANFLLWGVTRTAANAAKQAADAANVSAKAVAIVERAYVYPIITGHGPIRNCVEAGLASSEDDVPASMTVELTFKFKNFGKTPAILKTAFVGFGVYPLGAEIGLSIPEAVLGILEETNPLHSKMQMGVTRKQAQHILAYTGHVCFTGQITFDDIWGNENTTRLRIPLWLGSLDKSHELALG